MKWYNFGLIIFLTIFLIGFITIWQDNANLIGWILFAFGFVFTGAFVGVGMYDR